jgi:hypothetical protein
VSESVRGEGVDEGEREGVRELVHLRPCSFLPRSRLLLHVVQRVREAQHALLERRVHLGAPLLQGEAREREERRGEERRRREPKTQRVCAGPEASRRHGPARFTSFN